MSTATLTSSQSGTWDIDPVHSVLGFTVRHMMVSKVRGHFSEFEGTVTVDERLQRVHRRRHRQDRLDQHQQR